MKLTFEEIGCVERKWPEGVPFPEFDELRFYKHGGAADGCDDGND